MVGLISNRDETNYRSEVSRLARWCSDNVEKTKEIVVDFRRVHSLHAPLTINGVTMERVSSTKFLGVGMARYHNFGFGTIPECNTSVSIPIRYHR